MTKKEETEETKIKEKKMSEKILKMLDKVISLSNDPKKSSKEYVQKLLKDIKAEVVASQKKPKRRRRKPAPIIKEEIAVPEEKESKSISESTEKIDVS